MKFVVRLWVDVLVKDVQSREEAITIARNHRVDVEENNSAEPYDIQVSGEAWEKEDV